MEEEEIEGPLVRAESPIESDEETQNENENCSCIDFSSKEEVLYQMCLDGKHNIVYHFIKEGLDISGYTGSLAILCAACNGYLDIIKLLIRFGAKFDIGLMYRDKFIFEHISQHDDVIDYLIKYDALKNLQNIQKEYPVLSDDVIRHIVHNYI